MMLKTQDGSTVCIEPNLPSNTQRYEPIYPSKRKWGTERETPSSALGYVNFSKVIFRCCRNGSLFSGTSATSAWPQEIQNGVLRGSILCWRKRVQRFNRDSRSSSRRFSTRAKRGRGVIFWSHVFARRLKITKLTPSLFTLRYRIYWIIIVNCWWIWTRFTFTAVIFPKSRCL